MTETECLSIRAGTGPFRSDAAAMYFDIAVFDEMGAGRGMASGGIRADFTGCDPDQVRAGRLDWYHWARERGVDVLAQPVDIAPHVHAFNGGVVINPEAETTIPNLFACGEAAGGAHGANRIGGNQFAGTQVFGERAGRFAATRVSELAQPSIAPTQIAEIEASLEAIRRRETGPTPVSIQQEIQAAIK